MSGFPGIQGQGIEGDSSLYIRIAALATVPIMLVVSGIFGPKTGKVSNKFDLLVTPPGPFFSIWGVIYIGLIVSGIYCVSQNVWSLGVTTLFALVSLLNGLWVYVFNHATVKSNNWSLLIVLLMAVGNELQWIWMELPADADSGISTWNIVNRNIFAFYQGWLVAASNLNLGITLVYSLGVSKKTHAYIFWIVCPLCIVSMVALNLTRTEGFINNIAMYFSATYALIGAFISTRKRMFEDDKPLIAGQIDSKHK